jgi:hypothetical protein
VLCFSTGKVHPITGCEGPEGEQKYTSTHSLTLAIDGGRWLMPKDLVLIVQERVWAPGPLQTGAENLGPDWDSIPGPSSPFKSLYQLCYSGPLLSFSKFC